MRTKLTDTIAAAAVLGLTTLILVPAAVRAGQDSLQARQAATLSNAKQLGLALMMYCQDYDENYPPAAIAPGYLKGHSVPPMFEKSGWAGVTLPYIKSNAIYRSPALAGGVQPVQFMYNDLLSGVSLASLTAPAQTILVMDGEDVAPNAGHAWTKGAAPVGASVIKKQITDKKNKKVVVYQVAPGKGATVSTAPTRLNGGGIYTFADGHAKWLKPETVYFPPRASSNRHHEKGEGAPGEKGIASFRLD